MTDTLIRTRSEAFAEQGFVSPIPVLSPDEVAYYRGQCLAFEAGVDNGGIIWRRMLHVHFDWAFRLASHPAVLNAVEELLGPDIVVLSTILFSKPPDQTQYVSWHQDGRPMIR